MWTIVMVVPLIITVAKIPMIEEHWHVVVPTLKAFDIDFKVVEVTMVQASPSTAIVISCIEACFAITVFSCWPIYNKKIEKFTSLFLANEKWWDHFGSCFAFKILKLGFHYYFGSSSTVSRDILIYHFLYE